MSSPYSATNTALPDSNVRLVAPPTPAGPPLGGIAAAAFPHELLAATSTPRDQLHLLAELASILCSSVHPFPTAELNDVTSALTRLIAHHRSVACEQSVRGSTATELERLQTSTLLVQVLSTTLALTFSLERAALIEPSLRQRLFEEACSLGVDAAVKIPGVHKLADAAAMLTAPSRFKPK